MKAQRCPSDDAHVVEQIDRKRCAERDLPARLDAAAQRS
jgi:hypothetical protein